MQEAPNFVRTRPHPNRITPGMASDQPLALTDPSSLPAFTSEGTLQVVIETPKGSRNKFAFDHDRRVIVLKKTLPAGMVFPYDFGFIPSTLADDGDPIDVLVLMDEPAFPGCVLDARLIGVIEGEDELENGTQRNDRLLAIASGSLAFSDLQTAFDLPEKLLENMQDFFVNYPRLLGGKTYKVLATKGPDEAMELVRAAQATAS